MTDMRKLAEHMSAVRDLVSQLLIKHEKSVLEVMRELKADNIKLRAAAKQARTALSELIASADPLVYSGALRALDDALGTAPCAHVWKVTHSGQTYHDCRCDKCGATKRETWD
jgi:hypothetical protein